MPITYPLTLPLAPSSYVLEVNNIVSVSTSIFTGQQQVYSHEGKYWTATIEFPGNKRSNQAALIAFLTSLKGQYGYFRFGPYGAEATPRGVATGTPLVKGAGQAGSQTLQTDGWTPNVTNILRAGDYFQIGNNLYMCLKDVNSNSSGEASIDIFPHVRANTADNSPLTTSSPKGLFRLQDSKTSYNLTNINLYGNITINATEVLNMADTTT